MYFLLFTCFFLSSILHFSVGFDIPYTHLRRLVLLQKRIVRIISKKVFDAHTNPLFKSPMILKLEDIYSLHLGKFMFSVKNNTVPSSFSRSILRTNQVQINLYSFLPYQHKVFCFLSRSCFL